MCVREWCDQKAIQHGLCHKHAELWRVYGKEKSDREMSNEELFLDRGWDVVESGCWEYRGGHNSHGYGMVRKVRAHRIAYERVHGPVPARMLIRHSCDNPPCVNPDHLLVGTQKDNMADCLERKRNPRWEATHCSNGHEYTSLNDRGKGRAGRCRVCHNARQRRWKAERRKADL